VNNKKLSFGCYQQPNAITMAEHLKDEPSLQKKAKLGDGSNITAEDR
jgi:hypothetical protein